MLGSQNREILVITSFIAIVANNVTFYSVDMAIFPVQTRDYAQLKAGEVATGVDVQTEKRDAIEETRREKLSEFKLFVVERYSPYLVTNNVRTTDQIKSVLLNIFSQFEATQLVRCDHPWAVEKWRKEKKKKAVSMRGRPVGGFASFNKLVGLLLPFGENCVA